MELKRAKVVMLPTNDIVSLRKSKSTGELIHNCPNTYLIHSWIPQHLYFTTDEEIKEGDWGYDTIDNAIFQMNNQKGIDLAGDKVRKIVATTDKSLNINKVKDLFIEGNEDLFYSLPQPSQAFIEKYCKVGGIDDVMIEYVDWRDTEDAKPFKPFLKVDSHNTITIHSIKDSWSREEILGILSDVAETLTYSKDSDELVQDGLDKINELADKL